MMDPVLLLFLLLLPGHRRTRETHSALWVTGTKLTARRVLGIASSHIAPLAEKVNELKESRVGIVGPTRVEKWAAAWNRIKEEKMRKELTGLPPTRDGRRTTAWQAQSTLPAVPALHALSAWDCLELSCIFRGYHSNCEFFASTLYMNSPLLFCSSRHVPHKIVTCALACAVRTSARRWEQNCARQLKDFFCTLRLTFCILIDQRHELKRLY